MPDIQHIQTILKNKSPSRILKYALENFNNVAIAFSGAEDVVLIDMALHLKKNILVFSLDTGRLHPETYRFIETVRKHYKIEIEIITPDKKLLDPFVKQKGLYSFFKDGHQECCYLRKVEPTRCKLTQCDTWITGQRKCQNPNTRDSVLEVEIDTTFSTKNKQLIKFNPLLNWDYTQIWDYIDTHKVPYNELHLKGFASIGCEPCTRAVLPNQSERSGRWWWEKETKKECGLHSSNIQ